MEEELGINSIQNQGTCVSVTKAKKEHNQQKLVAVVLGAGHNPRLRNCGAKACLIMPDSRYLLQHQMEVLKKYNPSEIYLTIGYDSDRILDRKFDVRHIENQLWDVTGEAEELRLVLNASQAERMLILTGDLFLKDWIQGENSSWCLCHNGTDRKEEMGFLDEGDRITHFSYMYETKFSGLVMLEHTELQILKKTLNKSKAKFFLWEIIEDLIKLGLTFKAVHTNKAVKLNGINDLNKLKASF